MVLPMVLSMVLRRYWMVGIPGHYNTEARRVPFLQSRGFRIFNLTSGEGGRRAARSPKGKAAAGGRRVGEGGGGVREPAVQEGRGTKLNGGPRVTCCAGLAVHHLLPALRLLGLSVRAALA